MIFTGVSMFESWTFEVGIEFKELGMLIITWSVTWGWFTFVTASIGVLDSLFINRSNHLNTTDRRLKWFLASEFENSRQSSIATIWMERFGIPIWVLWITLTNAIIRQPKANMMLSFVKGIRLDMTKFLDLFWLDLTPVGLILRFLVLAMISEQIKQAVVTKPRIEKGRAPLTSFSDPM